MRRAIFNFRDFEEMIEKYNPFGFKNENGEICMFETYKDAYKYALRKLGDDMTAGFVDLPLYISKNTGLIIQEAEREAARMRPLWGPRDVQLIDLRNFKDGADSQLKNFIKCLHTITETKFDEASFQEALVWFKGYMDLIWLKIEQDENNRRGKGQTPTGSELLD